MLGVTSENDCTCLHGNDESLVGIRARNSGSGDVCVLPSTTIGGGRERGNCFPRDEEILGGNCQDDENTLGQLCDEGEFQVNPCVGEGWTNAKKVRE